MARTNTLGNFLTDVADAIRAKGGTSATIQASDFDTAIANLPSGGGTIEAEEKDVIFYDYDGTRVYSYTKADFLELSALPEVPTHDGLISQGWNYTLSDAKTFVTTYNKLDIGPYYITDDNATRIYIKLTNKDRLEPYLCFSLNGTATIDWGDNTTNTITSSDTSTIIKTRHTYSSVGDYVISITGGSLYLQGTTSYASSMLLSLEQNASYYANIYLNSIYKIEIGSNIADFGQACFAHLHNLKSITIPSYLINMSGTQEFYTCISLKYITFPYSFNLPQNCFNECASLKNISLHKNIMTINSYGFTKCYNLKRFIFNNPSSVTGFSSNFFQYCYNLKEVIKKFDEQQVPSTLYQYCTNLIEYIAPSTLTRINANAFGFCSSIKTYDFRACTSVPSLGATTAFNSIASDCVMIIPDSLFDTWSTASNWSSFASYMVKASEV